MLEIEYANHSKTILSEVLKYKICYNQSDLIFSRSYSYSNFIKYESILMNFKKL